MKTTRLRKKVRDILKATKAPMTLSQILDYINRTTRHGSTTQQLGNVLSKDKRFRRMDDTRRIGSRYGSYLVGTWTLSDRGRENN